MKKLYIKCEHRNITYKESWVKDEVPTVFVVKCADCNQEMPPKYQELIQERLVEQYRLHGNKPPFVKFDN